MLISIVIPTYNEEADIRATLDAALASTYPDKEILVIDDSTDRTPQILAEYATRGVTVIHRPSRANGCCGARNAGMHAARGEVVVLLNADVILGPDFLDRIAAHYAQGADFVVVGSQVLNTGALFARYIGARANLQYDGQRWLTWSEGFSCRREPALRLGGIPGDFPIPFCRDGLFGIRLQEAGLRKRVDTTIVAMHIAPAALGDYWRVRRTRGYISALFKFFLDGVPLPLLAPRIALKQLRAVGGALVVFPVAIESVRAAAYSPRRGRDVAGFMLANVLERFAYAAGEWRGFAALVAAAWSGAVTWRSTLGDVSRWRLWLPETRKGYLKVRTDA
jgi:glycosyltransferase involved in cell wall biosynthesis